MAASTDKFTKSYSFTQKSLGATIDDNDTSLTLNNYTNIPTDTAVHFIIDRIDSNGNRTNDTRELVKGVCNGSAVTNLTRGLHGTTAQSHESGAIVEFVASGVAWNELIDGILVEHNQDGTHGAVTATSVATDTITEDTAAAGVTIDGLLIKDSKLATADSVVTSNITNAAVTADKIAVGTVSTTTSSNTRTTTSTSYASLTDTLALTAGKWELTLKGLVSITNTSGAERSVFVTLSSDGSTETHPATTIVANCSVDAVAFKATMSSHTVVTLSGNTTFTLMGKVSGTSTTLGVTGAILPTVISARKLSSETA